MQPTIPKRPNKKISTEATDLSESTSNLIVSSDTPVDSVEPEQIPVIPSRPRNKEKQQSEQVEENKDSKQTEEPDKRQTSVPEPSVSTLVDVPSDEGTQADNKVDDHEQSDTNKNANDKQPIESEMDNAESKLDNEPVSCNQGDEQQLEKELKTSSDQTNNRDDDKSLPLIPQRPKSRSISDELNSSNSNAEEKDEVDGDKTPGNSNTKISFKDDITADESLVGDNSSFNDDQDTIQEKENEPQATESRIESAESNESTGPKVMPIIPKRPNKSQRSSIEPSSAKETDHEESSSSVLADVEASDALVTQGKAEIPTKSADDDKPPVVSETSLEPIEPQRPKKPPPKPKKLSSKIAAFQQLLSQPSDSSDDKSSKSQGKATETDSSKGKLSSSHMKFAQNLQGIMGRGGIALPGMVDPSKLKPSQSSTVQEFESVPEDTQDKPIRRAKGPKGKRLPKNLSEPINIEPESKLKVYTDNLWTLEFSKAIVHENEETEPTLLKEDIPVGVEESDTVAVQKDINPEEEKEETSVVETEPEQLKVHDPEEVLAPTEVVDVPSQENKTEIQKSETSESLKKTVSNIAPNDDVITKARSDEEEFEDAQTQHEESKSEHVDTEHEEAKSENHTNKNDCEDSVEDGLNAPAEIEPVPAKVEDLVHESTKSEEA